MFDVNFDTALTAIKRRLQHSQTQHLKGLNETLLDLVMSQHVQYF